MASYTTEKSDRIENEPKQKTKRSPSEFQEMIKLIQNNKQVKTFTQKLSEDAVMYIVTLICESWKIKEIDFIQTSLQVLFVLLENYKNLNIADMVHKILITYAKKKHSEKMPGKQLTDTNGPTTVAELCGCIESAAIRGQQIKAVGTNYSGLWTDIGHSNGMIIDTSRLTDSFFDVDCLTKEAEKEKQKYYHFEAGITMDKIQEKLWPSDERSKIDNKHRVFTSVTNGAGLSLAGTVATGAHGNGLRNKTVADAVVSFQMFTVDSNWKVKRYQIEPTIGITDADKFKEKATKDVYTSELIQNDVVFNASVVNIGCMGVVSSYVLETEKAFYLEEERIIYKWSVAKKIIRDLYRDETVYNFQVIGSPYAYKLSGDDTDEHRVLISILKKTNKTPKGNGKRSNGHINIQMGFLDKALVALGNSNPDLIPVIMHLSLMFLEHEQVVLNAVEALNTLSGVVSKKFSGVRTSECAMRSDGPETVIEIMEDLHELYSDIRRSNNRQIVNVPIALRFTAPSNKYMAMEYDCERPTITIEQSIISGTLGADDTLRKFRKRMYKNFQGRPHWGLLHELDAEKLKRLYGSYCRKKFTSALNYFDPKFVFENDFANWVFGEERRNNKEELLQRQIQQTQAPPPPPPPPPPTASIKSPTGTKLDSFVPRTFKKK